MSGRIINTALIALCTFGSTAEAALLRYDFSGDMTVAFQSQVTDDPLADLLGVAHNGTFNLPYTVSFVVDTASPPEVLQDTAAGQNFIYRHALESIRIDLNGAVFASTRRPDPLQEIIGIDVFNLTAPTGNDQVQFAFQDQGGGLFGDYFVPFNQTLNGVAVGDARVFVNSLSVFALGRGLLSDASLPDSAADLSGALAYGAAIQFGVGLSPSTGRDAVNAVHAFGTPYTFKVTPVPLPAAAWLLGSALVALGARHRRR